MCQSNHKLDFIHQSNCFLFQCRYHKPKAIVIERAGRHADHPHPISQGLVSQAPGQSSLNLSNVSEDRLALAVQLAKRDVKRRKEQKGSPTRTPSPKGSNRTRRPLVSKGKNNFFLYQTYFEICKKCGQFPITCMLI